ncbi:MAG: CPBP family intramembrane metalloprotease [Flavobacteriales bacterium]|nr:CPBP family intramembrane metalloprotease [Flavobacteriales bacterium]MBP6697534.1 CPBP family intramembrane metalloprotease [Flavobacteriales bacterium]
MDHPTAETEGPGRSVLRLLAALTLVGMGGLGLVLIGPVQGRAIVPVIIGNDPWYVLVVIGLTLGAITAAGAWWLLQRPYLVPVTERYTRLLRPWTGDRRDRWMISFSAGVGEELLFRGALQYWLGIPLTAIAFVALHGYLNPRDARVSVYGSYLVLCMFVYGLVAQHLGLLPAVIAHVLFDVVLLHRLNRHGSPVDE